MVSRTESEYSKENQRFLNSVAPTAYEQKMVAEEKIERKLNHDKYVIGIQGVDGGYFVRDSREM